MAVKTKPQTQQAEAPKIPTRADFPAIMQAQAKLDELNQQARNLAQRIESAPSSGAVDGGDVDAAAHQFLATATIPAPAAVAEHETREKLQRDLAIIRRAAQLQQEEISRLLRVCGGEASRSLQPRFLALAREGAALAVKLAEVVQGMRAISCGLADEQLLSTSIIDLNLLPSPLLLSPEGVEADIRQQHSAIGRWLHSLREGGVTE